MRRKTIKTCVIFLLAALFCSTQALASASLRPKSVEGSPAPDFTLETISGSSVPLCAYRGKGVILFFFTTWCPYCRKKFPELGRDYEKYRSENIELLVVDVGESQRKVSSFIARQTLPFDILLDVNMSTAEAYGVVGVPTFVLISKDGQVVSQNNDLPSNYKELLQ